MKMPRKRIVLPIAIVAALALLVIFWNWDWFIPMAQRQASAAIGRPVKITHLHVQLARRPVIDARATPDGQNNYTLKLASSGDANPPRPSPSPQIGDLRITDGHAHVLIPKLRTDFQTDISTRAADAGQPSQIIVEAKGTYANQPITGQFVGGALLSLRDKENPYPVNLHLANGPTKISLVGTVEDPLTFAGANLKLDLTGPDLGLLFPLTGIAIPETPTYSIAGQLDYANRKIRFTNFIGKVGSSDLEGDIEVDPESDRQKVTANLSSRFIDLADLAGFIGSTPGRKSTPNQSAGQKQELARADASSRVIPDVPINLPKLRATDVELRYKGAKIQGRSIPFDSVLANLTIQDGKLSLHPLTLTVGKGSISSNLALDSQGDVVHTRADIDFKQVDLSRLMSATHTFGGAGTIGGKAIIEGNGNSLAALLGHGNGELKLFMNQGGNISAILVDLSGLEIGNALLSALGIPTRAEVRCLVTDFVLQHGQLDTRVLLLDTTEANVTGTGNVDLAAETIKYRLRTEAKHFSIGSLPTDILVNGRLKRPSIGPDPVELGTRIGAAVGLGILLTPLGALLPTIQLGLGENNACAPLIRQAQTAPSANPVTTPPPRRTTR